MSTTLEKNDNKTATSQVGLPGNALPIMHPKLDKIINSELQSIAQDVLNAASLSFTNVIAKGNSTAGAAESALAVFMQKLPTKLRTDAQMRAQTLLRADFKAKEGVFGRFANINMDASSKSDFQQLMKQMEPLKIDLAKIGITGKPKTASEKGNAESLVNLPRFAELWGGSVPAVIEDVKSSGNARSASSIITGKVEFILTSLRCIDETGTEWQEKHLGDDEIALAGVAVTIIDNTTAATSTKSINERFLGKNYSDNVEQSLNNWMFGDFSLSQTSFWPKRFGMTLILAEKDSGGLADLMQAVWDATGPAITKALEAAAFAAGVTVGVLLFGPFGVIVGTALAAAAAWVVKELWKIIINGIKDDFFPPAVVWTNIESISQRWSGGSTTSPIMSERFLLHDGEYELNYQWRLTGLPEPFPDPIKQYKIVAKHSGMCLDVVMGSKNNNALLQQYAFGGGDNQLFRFESVGGDFYKITAKHSGLCLDVLMGSKDDGAPLQQYNYGSGDNQMFRLELVSAGFYKIVAKHSGKCLNVAWGAMGPGPVVQWPWSGGQDNELWQIIDVPFSATGDDIQPGEVLNHGKAIISSNGRYQLVYQGDGKLVLYDGNKQLWATDTWGKSVGVCKMQRDGNFVMYNADGLSIWSSNTRTPESKLVLQSDGNMVIYSPDGKPLWSTGTWQG